MWCVWEHVDRLHLADLVLHVEQLQVASLCGRIAADIDDALWGSIQDGLHHVGVHACSGWVGDDDIWSSMLCNEVVRQDILHVASIEQRVLNAVHLRVDFGVLDGFRHILDANHLTGFLRYEIGDGASACIQVVDQLIASKVGELAGYGVQMISLFCIRLIERLICGNLSATCCNSPIASFSPPVSS